MSEIFGRCIAIFVLGLLIVAGIGPAGAQATRAEVKRCTGNDAQAAIAACTRVLNQNRLSARDRSKAYYYRGRAHLRVSANDRAIRDLDEAIRLNPKFAVAFHNRGVAYAKKGNVDRAIRDFNEAIRLNPKLAAAYRDRGITYHKKGDYDRAIRDFNEAIRHNPKLAAAYRERGVIYHKKGDYDRAIRDYDEAIRLNPEDAAAFTNRGVAYRNKGDYDRAIRDFDEAIRLNPKLAAAYLYRGNVYAKKSQYDRAIRDYDEAIRLNPQYVAAFEARGVAYRTKGDFDRAIRDFDEAIRLNPKNADAYFGRGASYNRKHDYRQAIPDLDAAIRLNPKNAKYYLGRANTYYLMGEYNSAIRDYDEAIRLNPKSAIAYNDRGASYKRLNDLDRALTNFNEAVHLDPKLPRPYFHRGDIYLRKGNKERARADLQKALELNPKDEDARALLAKPDAAKPETKVAKVTPATPKSEPKAIINPAATGPRVALVIGNGKYRFAPELPNPTNDARDVAAALRELGFKVIEGYDLDSDNMRDKISEFGSAMAGATTTLFFYAGHGIQVAGKNYIVPTDAKLKRPSALGVEAIAVGTILADMETEQRTNLVFLDACRNNPLARSLARSFGATRSSSVGQGLAQINAGIGTLITFATSPNTVALDGAGRHSPFTKALLKHIRTPNIEIRTMITRVRADVFKATHGKQTPWDHSSLLGEFYFRRGG